MEDNVMIILVLGLLLLAVAVVLIVAAVAGTGDSVSFEVFGLDFEIWAWGVFVAGVVTTLIAVGGVIALRAGVQHIGTSRKEIEFLRQRVAELEQGESQAGPVEGSGAHRDGESSAQSNESTGRTATLS
jgi:hypothetical protein